MAKHEENTSAKNTSAENNNTSLENTATSEGVSANEVSEVIAGLEQYRERLIEDFTATAKKAKLPKSMVMAQLEKHPEILKIDASLAKLRGEETTD